MADIKKIHELVDEGNELLKTQHIDSIGREVVNRDDFYAWYTQILIYLYESLPENHVILEKMEKLESNYYKDAEKTVNILKGLMKHLEYEENNF